MANRKIQAILAQMQKNLECSICLEMMQNPISTACGHQFCRYCIMEFLERKKQVPCPLCKKSVTKRGLMEREQLGQMVSDVHKLIEAYQADTGKLFSPPRGSSMNMLPSTPESIKTKHLDQPAVRPMNTRRHPAVAERRKSLPKIEKGETKRITIEKKACKTKQKIKSYAENENAASELLDNYEDLQQLLDVIEMGTHGAMDDVTLPNSISNRNVTTFETSNLNDTVGVKNLKKQNNGKEDNHVLSDIKTVNSTDDLRDSLIDCTNVDEVTTKKDNKWPEGSKENAKKDHKENSPPRVKNDQTQSSESIISQTSSEDVVSLFRTPLDAKDIKQNQLKKAPRTTRSQRYKTVLEADGGQSDCHEPTILTPDNPEDSGVFTPKLETIRTYSKKGTLDKDNKSKRKVSDWLKNIQNTDKIVEKTAVKKSSNNEEIELKIKAKKGRGKSKKLVQQREEVMGQRMRKFADNVNEEDGIALFGFDGLDSSAICIETDNRNDDINTNCSGTNKVNENVTAEDIEHLSRLKDQSTKLNSDESNILGKDEMDIPGEVEINVSEKDKVNSPEKDEMNILEKDVINDLVKDEINMKEKYKRNAKETDQLNSIPTLAVVEKHEKEQEATKENEKVSGNKPVQRKRIFKSKQLVSVANDKSNCKENEQVNSEVIPPMEPDLKTEGSNGEHLTACKKPNRLLQLSDSPITSSSANLDPYEFKSSQKTPQKPKSKKKGGKTRSNKTKITFTNTAKDNVRRKTTNRNTVKQDQMQKNTDALINKTDRNENSQSSLEIKKVTNDLNQAEEYDLLTSTQEVLTSMKDMNNKSKGDENNVSKKKVRFKEPSLADFISPGKINVRLYRKEKQSYEKLALGTDKDKNSSNEKHSVDDLNMDEMKASKTEEQIEQNKQENIQNDHENDSDDLSEDFRFHDDSSGTDDLDINPEHDEFEPPNMDCQPQEIKEKLVEKVNLSIAAVENETKQTSPEITETIRPSPQMSCVMDTPQISTKTSLRTGFAFSLPACKREPDDRPVPETPHKNVVPEIPLLNDTVSECDNVKKEALVVKRSGKETGNGKDSAEITTESPIPAKKVDTESKESKHGKSESSIVLNSYENLDVEDNGETCSVGSVPLNMDINTLEDNDEETAVNSESGVCEKDDNHDIGNASETLIASKVDPESILLIENTESDDETQSPAGIVSDDFGVIVNTKLQSLKDNANSKDSIQQPEIVESVGCSQSSVSVLDLNQPGKEIADNTISGINLESTDARKDTADDNGNKPSKSGEKKRKCFMLEDTQELEQTAKKHASIPNKSKKQKILSSQSEDQVQGTGDHFPKSINIQQQQNFNVCNHKDADRSKRNSSNISQDIGLVSQSSVELESPGSRERHLSGILISPTEKTGDYQSPENIFCIESEMPAVALSPEEETQYTDESKEIISTVDSNSQRTHVSETQISFLEDSISDSSDMKRKDCVRASRGFSKRIKISEEEINAVESTLNTHVEGTPKRMSQRVQETLPISLPKTSAISTPKPAAKSMPKTAVTSTPKIGGIGSQQAAVMSTPKPPVVTTPKTPKINFDPSKDEGILYSVSNKQATSDVEIVTAQTSSISTPRQHNIMKYRSPVVGFRSGTSSPAPAKSPSLATRISKYSPGIRNTLQSPLSLKNNKTEIKNAICVEVVELNKINADKPKADVSHMDVEVQETEFESSEFESNVAASNKAQTKKKSPKLRLQLSSMDKQKLVESAQTTQNENYVDDKDNDKDLLKHSNSLQNSMNCRDLNENNDNESHMECDLPIIKQKNNICCPESSKEKSCEKARKELSHQDDQHDDVNDNQDLLSSSDLELNESDGDDDEGKLETKQDYFNSLESDNIKHDLADSYKPYSCLDLDFDTSDSDNDEEQIKSTHKEQGKNNKDKSVSKAFELEAEVIEESDLDGDSYNRSGTVGSQSDREIAKQDQDAEELRTVKQIRPKRAILSDSESDIDDESLKLDYTSSSAFSSQSDNLTTQEKEKLENDLEKMAAEMAQLKEQLNRNETVENKDPVVVLDDGDDAIEADMSDVEMTHEPCYSPPPYSPVIMSQQEKSLDDITNENEGQEMDKETDAQSLDVEDSGSIISSMTADVRQPLKDIDINIQRDHTNKTLKKTALGFLATGLSSAQVTEIKKLAAVNDVQFYMKMGPAVTHVIVKPADEDVKTCDRTLKFFQGIAHKCWVVSYQWITDSKQSGYLLPEAPYEIQGDSTMGSSHQGPKRSRLSKEDLFSGIHFSLFGDNKYLNQECISDLIVTCGGIVVDEKKLAECGRKTLVICCTDVEDENTQCENEVTQKSSEIKKNYGVLTLKRDWIMDSLTTYKLQSTKLYTV